ncbi:MAG: murein biosynthesis integral membrane protein MurJ [Candidatus Pacebacteria bacterium CG_4_10_14_0_8_um_filter_43_12]|nr:MAG: murein biosynthesis integral membrane protein MurJ [Candidatus Pacebacteria bacterium CG10_big_fil_rev_8_21_14_0_10_44_11]PIY79287.1 MAG: murein biosynthesis integral membrane protein MurJ [Candidatus Pacebacteria bacterium CG_4_10_14_0_8_um_filter_43_12]
MIAGLPLSKLFTDNLNMRWLENKQESILSAASIITIATIISALSGVLVKRLLIAQFGFGPDLEAFWIAFQIPDMMFQLIILGALSAAFIPIFTSRRKTDEQAAFKMSSIMMNLLLLVFICIGVVVFIFAKQITLLRTGDKITPEQIEIITNLTRVMLLSQFFFAISNFWTGILQSYHRFVIPALGSIMYNVGIMIGAYLFAQQYGIYAAGIGVVIGAFLHMGIQLPLVLKMGFRYAFTFDLRHDGIKEFFRLMPARFMALGAGEMRKLALGFFTTSLGNLSFSMMYLASNLMILPIRFTGTPLSQAALPFLSEESHHSESQHFRSLVLQSLNQISFLALPASVLLLILRLPVVRFAYGADGFPWEATLNTSWLVAIMTISVAAQALVQLLIRAFYALKDTVTPFVITAIDFILYCIIGGYLVFFTPFGIVGLAIATSVTAFVEFGLFLFLLNNKVKGLINRDFWIPQTKMIVASFLMAVFLYLPYRILDGLVFNTTRTIELIGLTITTGTIGMLVYLYFAALFDIKELQIFTKFLSKFRQKSKSLAQTPEVVVDTTIEDSGI